MSDKTPDPVEEAALNLDAWRNRLHDQAVIDGANALTELGDKEALAWSLTCLHGLANLDQVDADTTRIRAWTTLIQASSLAIVGLTLGVVLIGVIKAFQ